MNWQQLKSIAIIGETMLELTPNSMDASLNYNAAGDTYNTGVPLVQAGIEVLYVSGLGEDSASEFIRADFKRYGVSDTHVAVIAGKAAGMYMIKNDADGERHFSYWRSDSAAKNFLSNASMLGDELAKMSDVDAIFLSGITLALMSEQSRAALFDFLDSYRQVGGRVIYDSNYRPALWQSQQTAATALSQILKYTDVFLPSVEDLHELLLGGCEIESEQQLNEKITTKLQEYKHISETVMTKGGGDLELFENGQSLGSVELEKVAKVIDTTGAGDSFNAGYMAARVAGYAMVDSVQRAHSLAAAVIQQQGAILPLEMIKPLVNEH